MWDKLRKMWDRYFRGHCAMDIRDAITALYSDESWQGNLIDMAGRRTRSIWAGAAIRCLDEANTNGADLAVELARQLRILRGVNEAYK